MQGLETSSRQLVHYVKYLGLSICSTESYTEETTTNNDPDKGTMSSPTLDTYTLLKDI